MTTPRQKAIELISKLGFQSAKLVASNMTYELGLLALTADTKEHSDEIKDKRFYWNTIFNIKKKEWHQRKLSI